MKICHLTSVHLQEDIRIFHKECVSLVKAGYDTYLISSGNSYEKLGVKLIGVGEQETSRIDRMTKLARKIYNVAVSLDADIYHIHDPELLPYGLKLKKLGKKVIFDSHEDVPGQILDKGWIPKPLRIIVSKVYKAYETHVVKQLDAVVAATSHIAKSFAGKCKEITIVNNYPKLDDIKFHETPFSKRDPIACYAGGIDELRGEGIMIEAMKGVDGQLIIAGDHNVMEMDGVSYIGRQDRSGINELYGKSVVGLCILKPIENYYYSKPIKIYEYMAAGLPVVCSNFPLWKKIVEENDCGVCVNCQNSEDVRNAIRQLIENPNKGQKMGLNGRKAIVEKYNWENEEKELLALYGCIGGKYESL